MNGNNYWVGDPQFRYQRNQIEERVGSLGRELGRPRVTPGKIEETETGLPGVRQDGLSALSAIGPQKWPTLSENVSPLLKTSRPTDRRSISW